MKFKNLTKYQKRVALAKDVIKHLKDNKIRIKNGVFLNFRDKKVLWGQQLDKVIRKHNKPCNVCALGSLFICQIMREDNYIIPLKNYYGKGIYNFLINDCDIKNILNTYFDVKQQALIEIAFECGKGYYRVLYNYMGDKVRNIFNKSDNNVTNEIEKALGFGKRYKKKYERLMAIMNNIVKNKGIFKP